MKLRKRGKSKTATKTKSTTSTPRMKTKATNATKGKRTAQATRKSKTASSPRASRQEVPVSLHPVPSVPAIGRAEAPSARDRASAWNAHLQSIFHLILAKYGHRPAVTGVDVGFRRKDGQWTSDLVVRIHVREKIHAAHIDARDVFPRRVDGVAIDVVQSAFENHEDLFDRRRRRDPAQPGISVGPAAGPAGTLGAFMFDNVSQATCVLSAAHVLFARQTSIPGDAVVQPARMHGGVADGFARLARFDTVTDAAIAVLESGAASERLVSGVAVGTAVEFSAVAEPHHGQVLTKSGASTGVTTAIVDGIGAFEGLEDAFILLPVEGGPEVISKAGDSGAVWYDAQTGAAVGLHCKGPRNAIPGNSFAVASRFSRIMQNLQLAFVTFT